MKKTIVLCKKKNNKQLKKQHYVSLPQAMELLYYKNKTIIIYQKLLLYHTINMYYVLVNHSVL